MVALQGIPIRSLSTLIVCLFLFGLFAPLQPEAELVSTSPTGPLWDWLAKPTLVDYGVTGDAFRIVEGFEDAAGYYGCSGLSSDIWHFGGKNNLAENKVNDQASTPCTLLANWNEEYMIVGLGVCKLCLIQRTDPYEFAANCLGDAPCMVNSKYFTAVLRPSFGNTTWYFFDDAKKCLMSAVGFPPEMDVLRSIAGECTETSSGGGIVRDGDFSHATFNTVRYMLQVGPGPDLCAVFVEQIGKNKGQMRLVCRGAVNSFISYDWELPSCARHVSAFAGYIFLCYFQTIRIYDWSAGVDVGVLVSLEGTKYYPTNILLNEGTGLFEIFAVDRTDTTVRRKFLFGIVPTFPSSSFAQWSPQPTMRADAGPLIQDVHELSIRYSFSPTQVFNKKLHCNVSESLPSDIPGFLRAEAGTVTFKGPGTASWELFGASASHNGKLYPIEKISPILKSSTDSGVLFFISGHQVLYLEELDVNSVGGVYGEPEAGYSAEAPFLFDSPSQIDIVEKEKTEKILEVVINDFGNSCFRSIQPFGSSPSLVSLYFGTCRNPGSADGPSESSTVSMVYSFVVTSALRTTKHTSSKDGPIFFSQANGLLRKFDGNYVSTIRLSCVQHALSALTIDPYYGNERLLGVAVEGLLLSIDLKGGKVRKVIGQYGHYRYSSSNPLPTDSSLPSFSGETAAMDAHPTSGEIFIAAKEFASTPQLFKMIHVCCFEPRLYWPTFQYEVVAHTNMDPNAEDRVGGATYSYYRLQSLFFVAQETQLVEYSEVSKTTSVLFDLPLKVTSVSLSADETMLYFVENYGTLLAVPTDDRAQSSSKIDVLSADAILGSPLIDICPLYTSRNGTFGLGKTCQSFHYKPSAEAEDIVFDWLPDISQYPDSNVDCSSTSRADGPWSSAVFVSPIACASLCHPESGCAVYVAEKDGFLRRGNFWKDEVTTLPLPSILTSFSITFMSGVLPFQSNFLLVGTSAKSCAYLLDVNTSMVYTLAGINEQNPDLPPVYNEHNTSTSSLDSPLFLRGISFVVSGSNDRFFVGDNESVFEIGLPLSDPVKYQSVASVSTLWKEEIPDPIDVVIDHISNTTYVLRGDAKVDTIHSNGTFGTNFSLSLSVANAAALSPNGTVLFYVGGDCVMALNLLTGKDWSVGSQSFCGNINSEFTSIVALGSPLRLYIAVPGANCIILYEEHQDLWSSFRSFCASHLDGFLSKISSSQLFAEFTFVAPEKLWTNWNRTALYVADRDWENECTIKGIRWECANDNKLSSAPITEFPPFFGKNLSFCGGTKDFFQLGRTFVAQGENMIAETSHSRDTFTGKTFFGSSTASLRPIDGPIEGTSFLEPKPVAVNVASHQLIFLDITEKGGAGQNIVRSMCCLDNGLSLPSSQYSNKVSVRNSSVPIIDFIPGFIFYVSNRNALLFFMPDPSEGQNSLYMYSSSNNRAMRLSPFQDIPTAALSSSDGNFILFAVMGTLKLLNFANNQLTNPISFSQYPTDAPSFQHIVGLHAMDQQRFLVVDKTASCLFVLEFPGIFLEGGKVTVLLGKCNTPGYQDGILNEALIYPPTAAVAGSNARTVYFSHRTKIRAVFASIVVTILDSASLSEVGALYHLYSAEQPSENLVLVEDRRVSHLNLTFLLSSMPPKPEDVYATSCGESFAIPVSQWFTLYGSPSASILYNETSFKKPQGHFALDPQTGLVLHLASLDQPDLFVTSLPVRQPLLVSEADSPPPLWPVPNAGFNASTTYSREIIGTLDKLAPTDIVMEFSYHRVLGGMFVRSSEGIVLSFSSSGITEERTTHAMWGFQTAVLSSSLDRLYGSYPTRGADQVYINECLISELSFDLRCEAISGTGHKQSPEPFFEGNSTHHAVYGKIEQIVWINEAEHLLGIVDSTNGCVRSLNASDAIGRSPGFIGNCGEGMLYLPIRLVVSPKYFYILQKDGRILRSVLEKPERLYVVFLNTGGQITSMMLHPNDEGALYLVDKNLGVVFFNVTKATRGMREYTFNQVFFEGNSIAYVPGVHFVKSQRENSISGTNLWPNVTHITYDPEKNSLVVLMSDRTVRYFCCFEPQETRRENGYAYLNESMMVVGIQNVWPDLVVPLQRSRSYTRSTSIAFAKDVLYFSYFGSPQSILPQMVSYVNSGLTVPFPPLSSRPDTNFKLFPTDPVGSGCPIVPSSQKILDMQALQIGKNLTTIFAIALEMKSLLRTIVSWNFDENLECVNVSSSRGGANVLVEGSPEDDDDAVMVEPTSLMISNNARIIYSDGTLKCLREQSFIPSDDGPLRNTPFVGKCLTHTERSDWEGKWIDGLGGSKVSFLRPVSICRIRRVVFILDDIYYIRKWISEPRIQIENPVITIFDSSKDPFKNDVGPITRLRMVVPSHLLLVLENDVYALPLQISDKDIVNGTTEIFRNKSDLKRLAGIGELKGMQLPTTVFDAAIRGITDVVSVSSGMTNNASMYFVVYGNSKAFIVCCTSELNPFADSPPIPTFSEPQHVAALVLPREFPEGDVNTVSHYLHFRMAPRSGSVIGLVGGISNQVFAIKSELFLGPFSFLVSLNSTKRPPQREEFFLTLEPAERFFFVGFVTLNCIEMYSFLDASFSPFAGSCQSKGGYREMNRAAVLFSKPTDAIVFPLQEALIVVDSDNHCLRTIPFSRNETSEPFAGQCTEGGIVDGHRLKARFSSPSKIINYGLLPQLLYVISFGLSPVVRTVIRRILFDLVVTFYIASEAPAYDLSLDFVLEWKEQPGEYNSIVTQYWISAFQSYAVEPADTHQEARWEMLCNINAGREECPFLPAHSNASSAMITPLEGTGIFGGVFVEHDGIIYSLRQFSLTNPPPLALFGPPYLHGDSPQVHEISTSIEQRDVEIFELPPVVPSLPRVTLLEYQDSVVHYESQSTIMEVNAATMTVSFLPYFQVDGNMTTFSVWRIGVKSRSHYFEREELYSVSRKSSERKVTGFSSIIHESDISFFLSFCQAFPGNKIAICAQAGCIRKVFLPTMTYGHYAGSEGCRSHAERRDGHINDAKFWDVTHVQIHAPTDTIYLFESQGKIRRGWLKNEQALLRKIVNDFVSTLPLDMRISSEVSGIFLFSQPSENDEHLMYVVDHLQEVIHTVSTKNGTVAEMQNVSSIRRLDTWKIYLSAPKSTSSRFPSSDKKGVKTISSLSFFRAYRQGSAAFTFELEHPISYDAPSELAAPTLYKDTKFPTTFINSSLQNFLELIPSEVFNAAIQPLAVGATCVAPEDSCYFFFTHSRDLASIAMLKEGQTSVSKVFSRFSHVMEATALKMIDVVFLTGPTDNTEVGSFLYTTKNIHCITQEVFADAQVSFDSKQREMGNCTKWGYAAGGPKTALLNRPTYLVPLSNNVTREVVLFADTFNHCIRRIVLNKQANSIIGVGWINQSVASFISGTCGSSGNKDGSSRGSYFSYPQVLALSPSKRLLYVIDSGNSLIRKVDLFSHTVATVTTSSSSLQGGESVEDHVWESVFKMQFLYENLLVAMDRLTGSVVFLLLHPEKANDEARKVGCLGKFCGGIYNLSQRMDENASMEPSNLGNLSKPGVILAKPRSTYWDPEMNVTLDFIDLADSRLKRVSLKFPLEDPPLAESLSQSFSGNNSASTSLPTSSETHTISSLFQNTTRSISSRQEKEQPPTCLLPSLSVLPSEESLFKLTLSPVIFELFLNSTNESEDASTDAAVAQIAHLKTNGTGTEDVILSDESVRVVSVNVTGADHMFISLAADPKIDRFSTRHLEISISNNSFTCDSATHSLPVHLTLKKSPAPVPLEVRQTLGVVTATSGIVSSTVALQQQRANLGLALAHCEFSSTEKLDFGTHPLQFGYGGPNGFFFRGGVIGNAIIFIFSAGVALFVAGVHFLAVRKAKGSFQSSLDWVRLPGILVMPLAILLQNFVLCCTAVALHGEDRFDLVIGGVGLLICLIIIILIFVRTVRKFQAVYEDLVDVSATQNAEAKAAIVKLRASAFFFGKGSWRNTDADYPFKERFGRLFADYRSKFRWFLTLELVIALCAGVSAGIQPKAESGCGAVAGVVLLLASIIFVAYVALRPFTAPFDNVHSIAVSGATVLCIACATASQQLSEDMLLSAAQWMSSAVIVLGLFKACFDIIIFVRRMQLRSTLFDLLHIHRLKPNERPLLQGEGESGADIEEEMEGFLSVPTSINNTRNEEETRHEHSASPHSSKATNGNASEGDSGPPSNQEEEENIDEFLLDISPAAAAPAPAKRNDVHTFGAELRQELERDLNTTVTEKTEVTASKIKKVVAKRKQDDVVDELLGANDEEKKEAPAAADAQLDEDDLF